MHERSENFKGAVKHFQKNMYWVHALIDSKWRQFPMTWMISHSILAQFAVACPLLTLNIYFDHCHHAVDSGTKYQIPDKLKVAKVFRIQLH